MNPDLDRLLAATANAMRRTAPEGWTGPVRLGVDLGTAYTVLIALDADGTPLTGAWEQAEVVRDGLVVDFAGATALVRRLKGDLEHRLGVPLTTAATTYPPGVPLAEVRATRYVLEAAGLDVTAMVDEPTAANAVLGLADGAVVDIGGGTTGIALLRDGQVVSSADEPTGGHHLTLVVAGAMGLDYAAAEALKTNPARQPELLAFVRPVLEKIASIVRRHVSEQDVVQIVLVGGTSSFAHLADIVADLTGIPTSVPTDPLFVTPLGVARHDQPDGAGPLPDLNGVPRG